MGIEELPDDIGDPPMYYDPDGNPCGLRTWARLRQDRSVQVVAQEEVDLPGGDRAFVSTVWLGMDHSFGYGRQPLIFETMIFWEAGNYASEDYCERWTTRAQALAGHDQALEHARHLGLAPEPSQESES